MAKLRVGLLFGGRSVEHEVSIASATSILQALDRERYAVSLIAVDHEGRWHLAGADLLPEQAAGAPEVTLPAIPGAGVLVPVANPIRAGEAAADTDGTLDVILPIIHGRGGEDGAVQGLFELAEVAYVGSGVLGSAIQMDKDVAKRLLAAAGLPVLPWVAVQTHVLAGEGVQQVASAAARELGFPVFVKPANSGSSVGIAKADDLRELVDSLLDAARYDSKVLIEKGIDARELEVAVLGNDRPEASVVGEIRIASEFYDYESKYHDDATELLVPAPLSEEVGDRLRALAIQAFQIVEAQGLARVDFLLDRSSGKVYLNELNSLPGFTKNSMYPRLWEATGLPYGALLDRLIELALERYARRRQLVTHHLRPRAGSG